MTINSNFYFHHLVFKCHVSKEMWDKKSFNDILFTGICITSDT